MRPLKLIKVFTILAALVCLHLVFAGTTGKITGTVVDSEDKQPVPGSKVKIEGTTMGAEVSSIDGAYVIQDVPPGTYSLIAECIGYEDSRVDTVVVLADCITEINFELVPTGIKAEDIVVEAVRAKITKHETSTVTRVSTKEIGALPVADIQGIVKTQTGFVEQGDALHVRGSRKGELAFVDDGILIREQLGGYGESNKNRKGSTPISKLSMNMSGANGATNFQYQMSAPFNTEDYGKIYENEFKSVIENPLSTFSIDVDAASYSNMRRYINTSILPPTDAVRIEELINYFNYDYPQPDGDDPFAIITEVSDCPWNDSHRLIHLGLQGKRIKTENLPPSNIVFLLDVSGSMNSYDKLPLLKSAFKLLVNELREEDRIAIVVYAGSSGLVLPSIPGNRKEEILAALNKLRAGGCTAGAAGIRLAYEVATKNFKKSGNNRVILATDGDFNVGVSSNSELVELIEKKRETGVFLSVLGFGTGNIKDDKMEQLADKGNGNYSYIDNIMEARKVLVSEMGGTLYTIAKDVKIQIEFNPTQVKAYRLIGYENRLLAKEDFNDDTKDAGELGSGHSVTALYEVIPTGSDEEVADVDELKYQVSGVSDEAIECAELLTVKFRYKDPDGSKSKLIVQTLVEDDTVLEETSDNFRFSAAVAEFGMLLRDSKFKADASFDQVLKLAKKSKGRDDNNYRTEFIRLVETAKLLTEAVAER